MTTIQEAFEKAWEISSTNRITKEEAMNWFFEGVAAQKAINSTIRTADVEKFAAMRNANPAGGYRQGLNCHRTMFFYEFIRQLNLNKVDKLQPSLQEVAQAVHWLGVMERSGVTLTNLLITNYTKGNVLRYRDYPGFDDFDNVLKGIIARLPAASPSTPLAQPS